MTAEEAARLTAFASASRRTSFALGRTLARRLCAGVLGHAPLAVPLVVEGSGRLTLPNTGFDLTLAHSEDRAGAIVAPFSIGLDVERVRPRDARLWDRILAPGEARPAWPGWTDDERLMLAWTAKEAVLKGRGVGLRAGAASVRVAWPEAEARVVEAASAADVWRVAVARHEGFVWAAAWRAG